MSPDWHYFDHDELWSLGLHPSSFEAFSSPTQMCRFPASVIQVEVTHREL